MPQAGRRTIDSRALYDAIERKRSRLGLSWRTVGVQITGTHSPTLARRLQEGRPVSADMLGSILMWLDTYDIRPFLLAFRPGRRFTAGPGSPPSAG